MNQQVFLVEYFPIVHGRSRSQGLWATDMDESGKYGLVSSRRHGLTTPGVRRFSSAEDAAVAGDALLADGVASAYQVQAWTLAG